MLPNDIRHADAVRHMSVDAGTWTADRADSHGHRPQNRLTCQNTQGRPPWAGEDAFYSRTHRGWSRSREIFAACGWAAGWGCPVCGAAFGVRAGLRAGWMVAGCP